MKLPLIAITLCIVAEFQLHGSCQENCSSEQNWNKYFEDSQDDLYYPPTDEESCYDCFNGFYVEGDYLYWRPRRKGLDIAGKGSIFPGDIKRIDYDWTSGFRAKAGWNFCDFWSLQAGYTYLRPKGSFSLSSEEIFVTSIPEFLVTSNFILSGGFLTPLLAQSEFFSASSSLSLNYNTAVLSLANIFFNFCNLCVSVSYGIEGAWVNEKLNTSYGTRLRLVDASSGSIPLFGNFFTTIFKEDSWKYQGYGLMGAVQAQHFWDCGLFLNGLGKIGILYGEFQNNYSQNLGEIIIDSPDFIPIAGNILDLFRAFYTINGSEDFFDFVPNLQLNLNLGYEYCYCGYNFQLKAGWDMVYWHNLAVQRTGLFGKAFVLESENLNNVAAITSNTATTNIFSRGLAMHGLVVSAQVKF